MPLVDFDKGQRKDDVIHEYLARCDGTEQLLFIGRAEEKTTTFRTSDAADRARARHDEPTMLVLISGRVQS